jgi:carboxymethylenebutenolidase
MAPLVPIPSPGFPLYYGEEGAPLVILVHDWFGRLPWLDSLAKAFQHRGYRVAVPDLYDGFATTDTTDASRLLTDLDVATALEEFDEIIQDARADGSTRFATVGFSMGGWLSLLHAQGGGVDAVVAYYATLASSQHGVVPCPELLQFAETDSWRETEDPESFIDRLKEHGTPVTEFRYLGTAHGFANASVPGGYDANASALAFARTESFLENHLAN